MADVQEGRSSAEHPIEAALAEVEDLLSYCNDIIATGTCHSSIRFWALVSLIRTACGADAASSQPCRRHWCIMHLLLTAQVVRGMVT